ncbi:NAC transcription factor 32-like [Phoenix dactylifera]|uniref:NAC transcription factor 32-like n=1 Tax=Phoenix dactylifera TaxID=42345 RepID=A0A8B7CSC1_PHODC|nr:NAC transcription factor 32-like [Phoenix dactylifera]
MEEEASEVPSGIRFRPTDKELILYYLRPWLRCEKLPCNIINEADQYDGTHPEFLTALYEPAEHGGPWYFFMQVTPISSSKKRLKRSNEIGQWKMSHSQDLKNKRKEKIGVKSMLNYYEFHGKNKKKTGWILYEYRIAGYEKAIRVGDWALCKIYLNRSNKKSNDADRIIAPTIQHPPMAMSSFPSGFAALPPPYKIGGGHEVQQGSVGSGPLDSDRDVCRRLAPPSCFAPSFSFPSILEAGTKAHSQEVGALGGEQCRGSSTQLLDLQAEDVAGPLCHEDDYNLSITLDELEEFLREDNE